MTSRHGATAEDVARALARVDVTAGRVEEQHARLTRAELALLAALRARRVALYGAGAETLNLATLAETCEMQVADLSRFLNGRKPFRMAWARRVAAALDAAEQALQPSTAAADEVTP